MTGLVALLGVLAIFAGVAARYWWRESEFWRLGCSYQGVRNRADTPFYDREWIDHARGRASHRLAHYDDAAWWERRAQAHENVVVRQACLDIAARMRR